MLVSILIKKFKNIFYFNLFVITIVVCFQATDIKIYDIKLPELIMILLFPFLLFKGTVDKFTLGFLITFTLLYLSSIFINFNTIFYLDFSKFSFIKHPYYISLSRYLELISCISFLLFCQKGFMFLKYSNIQINNFLDKFIRYNAYLGLFFIIMLIPILLNITLATDSLIYYSQFGNFARLKGFFYEGGPLGLMFSFLLCICYATNKGSLSEKSIFFTVLFLSKSKSGLMLLILWFLFMFLLKFKNNFFNRLIVGICVSLFAILLLYKVSDLYIQEFKQVHYKINTHSDDKNLLLGRIPAVMAILPNMVKNNPCFGVGLGNYSLVRNDPRYRGKFPHFEEWDLSGMGGLLTLIAEGGLFFTILLLAIYFKFLKYVNNISIVNYKIGFLFILTLLLGVQLTFTYPWFAIILALKYESN